MALTNVIHANLEKFSQRHAESEKENKKPPNPIPRISEKNKIDLSPRAMRNKSHPNLSETEMVEIE